MIHIASDNSGWVSNGLIYRTALDALVASGTPFLVGGGYAFEAHTGIRRSTKDIDIFVLPDDVGRTLDVLGRAGYRTELTFPHWIGKAFANGEVIDIIFNSGNGVCPVDSAWFEHATEAVVLGLPLKICPAEEVIWQKAFIMERDRHDGGDIMHLLRACGRRLDWRRLLDRFGDHWRVLLSHLVLFGFVYPGEHEAIPPGVQWELLTRLEREICAPAEPGRLCRGTLLSLLQYRVDVEQWRYDDARLEPIGGMTPSQVEQWQTAFDRERQAKAAM